MRLIPEVRWAVDPGALSRIAYPFPHSHSVLETLDLISLEVSHFQRELFSKLSHDRKINT